MGRKYFRTDGIRGEANRGAMTPQTVLKIAMAAGICCRQTERRHRVVIGKDTRLSGYMIETALVAGFTSVGMDVLLLGPLPTPAVAMLTRSMRADLGIMISASHNPFQDNGMKFFGADGHKLSHGEEQKIEHLVDTRLADHLAAPENLGRASRIDGGAERYSEFIKATLPRNVDFVGLKIAVDCANGSACRVAPNLLWELGAELVKIGVEPDGFNINRNCGSTDTRALAQAVIDNGAHIGLAFDGDADRLIALDENGREIDGDHLLASIATDWHSSGRLSRAGIAVTHMSNLGLDRYLATQGLAVTRTDVGDRNVAEAMRQNHFNLGGEQSGHIILSDFSTTGDGLIAAMQILAQLKQSGMPASTLSGCFEPMPQIMKNVPCCGQNPLANPDIAGHVEAARARLAEDEGLLLVRQSGTEPVIRLMAQGPRRDTLEETIGELAQIIAAPRNAPPCQAV